MGMEELDYSLGPELGFISQISLQLDAAMCISDMGHF